MEELADALYQLCLNEKCPRDIQFNAEHIIVYGLYEKRTRNEHLQTDPTYVKLVSSKDVIQEAEAKWKNALKCHAIVQQPSKYICTICHSGAGLVINSVKSVLKHVMDKLHITAESVHELDRTSVLLPEPTEEHCKAVSKVLQGVLENIQMTSEDVTARQNFVQELNAKLADLKCGIQLVVMGSSLTGLGFKRSDLNVYASQEASPEKRDTDIDDWALLGKVISGDERVGELTAVLAEKSFTANVKLGIGGEETCVRLNLCTNSNNAFQHIQLNTLFQNYVVICPMVQTLTVAFRILMQMLKLDDPDRNGLSPEVVIMLVIHYLQKEAGLPVLKLDGAEVSWQLKDCNKETNPGYQWMKLLKFYSQLDVFEKGIGILESYPNLQHGSFTGVRIPIQHPLQPQLNMHRISNSMAGKLIATIRRLCRYFGIPRSLYGPVYDLILEEEGRCSPIVLPKVIGATEETTEAYLKLIHAKEGIFPGKSNCPETATLLMHERASGEWEIERSSAAEAETLFPSECYFYEWTRGSFGIKKDQFPELKCRTCHKAHAIKNCTVDKWVRPKNEGSLDATNLRVLSEMLNEYKREEGLDEFASIKRKRVIADLENCIRKHIRAVKLHEFGSGVNGFGNKHCDIDLCMTVSANDDIETLEYDDLSPNFVHLHLERVNRALRFTVYDYSDVVFIRTARVPIVKFRHKKTDLEGDISMSNYLAHHNSQLLRAYSCIDPRVSILGLFLKYVMKICGLSDVCTGGLSSYAHVLMLIHYLQQDVCQPAVLPVLQQLPSKKLPSKAQGWTIHYFGDADELSELAKHWDEYGGNRDSVGKLFLGFLHYYTEVFDYEKHVITIRQKEPLTRIEKFWSNPSLISIEDPFLLTHDLGRTLKRHASLLIVTTFANLRKLIYKLATSGELERHFFDELIEFSAEVERSKGNAGALPKCKRCKEFGHTIKKCPRNLQNDRHQQKRDRVPSNSDSHASDDSSVASNPSPAVKPSFRKPPPRKKMMKTRIVENSVYKPPI